jgi:hypothetical protein
VGRARWGELERGRASGAWLRRGRAERRGPQRPRVEWCRTPAATRRAAPDRGRAGRGRAREQKAGVRERPGRLALVCGKRDGGPLSQKKLFFFYF